MKLPVQKIKEMLTAMGFAPQDGATGLYCKKYASHHNYSILIDFNLEKIHYRQAGIAEDKGIQWGDATTSNFESAENFVVLECINRLLEKGYAPQNIILEKKYPLGRDLKGKLDILVTDFENNAFLMIECKTWGSEYEKESKKMLKDGGQLFSYYAMDRYTKYLCLYTSHLGDTQVEYKNSIVSVDTVWRELAHTAEIYNRWNKNFKDNGIFEVYALPYIVKHRALTYNELKTLTKESSGKVFNQIMEILRHNAVSDKPNAFNKLLNLFVCKIIDETKNINGELAFQCLETDSDETLQMRLSDLYKEGMKRFLEIDVIDHSEDAIHKALRGVFEESQKRVLLGMFQDLRLKKSPNFAFVEVLEDNTFQLNAKIVREIVELLQIYKFRYEQQHEFLGNFFELLLNTSMKQEAGQFFTPVPITRFVISSLPLKELVQKQIDRKVRDPLPALIDYACGSGHFLTEYMSQMQYLIEKVDVSNAARDVHNNIKAWQGDVKFLWAEDSVYGIDFDNRLVKTTKVSAFFNGDGEANVVWASGLDHFAKSVTYRDKLKLPQGLSLDASPNASKDNAQFDILVSNPPYSVKDFKATVKHGAESFDLFDRLSDNSAEIECLFVERMKHLLKEGGIAAVILPSSLLSNTGIYTATREILLKYFKLIAIVELGSNTFMATGTNTVTLFLERRANSDHQYIQSAVEAFFEKPKDVTVFGIEHAFSKYVHNVFEGIRFEDYVSFIEKNPNAAFTKIELFADWQNAFENSTDIKNLKKSHAFKKMSGFEQKAELDKRFFARFFALEKEKMLYFLLTYQQKTIVVKTGEKQAEKDFLGYEFSNRRGHEGLRALPNGTKLYDESGNLNPEKANFYIYNAFMGKYPAIDESIIDNVFLIDSCMLIDFSRVQFEKAVYIKRNTITRIQSRWQQIALSKILIDIQSGSRPKGGVSYIREGVFSIGGEHINLKGTLDVSSPKYVPEDFYNSATQGKVKPCDILMCKDGALTGKISLVSEKLPFEKMMVNEHVFILRTDNFVTQNYVFIMLFSANGQTLLKNSITGQAQGGLNATNLKHIKIPLPPMEVQEKIVAEIGAIKAAEVKNTNTIESLKNRLFAADYFAFPTERIEKVALLVQRGKSASYGTSNIQIIKSGQARGYTEFDFSRRHYVSEEFVSDERNLQKGDILINSTGVGTAGRVTLFDLNGDFVADSHITIVRLDHSKALPKYILYALAHIGFKTIENMATGQSGQIEISLSIIKGIQVPLPPLDKQKAIVAHIEALEKEIHELEAEIATAEEQKKYILQKYL